MEPVHDDAARMHRYDPTIESLAQAVMAYALDRVRLDPPPLCKPETPAQLDRLGPSITDLGLGPTAALELFTQHLAPTCISQDHPRNLAFVPAAATELSVLFDLVVGASSIFAGSWMEGSGAVWAENQALRWLADLCGLPADAGGVFVSGGSAGNLSALVAARYGAQQRRADRPERWLVAASSAVHSSVAAAARVMDVDVVAVPVDREGRLTGAAFAETLRSLHEVDGESPGEVFAVVATGGTTNAGIVDDLAGIADVCAAHGIWLHVDGAYGGAALAAPSVRHRFDGIERADSVVVDPHKWLFAPYDCAALLYRDPATARGAHTQHAGYLDVLHEADEWNPSDYAFHLSRRARGLPFWFSLASHGTVAYTQAVEATLQLARDTARLVETYAHLELLAEPELSVVVFRRIGWRWSDYDRWSKALLDAGTAFVVPTTWQREAALRFCFVNPRTTLDDVETILASLS